MHFQFQRRVRDNPHINYTTDSFGSDKQRKNIDQKVADLLKDPFYPESEFRTLKLETILVENELNDTKKKRKETKEKMERIEKKMWNYNKKCKANMNIYKEKLEKMKKKMSGWKLKSTTVSTIDTKKS